MVRTQEKKVPWLWVGLMVLPMFGDRLVGATSQGLLALILDKFTHDPSVVTFFSSIHIVLAMVVTPLIAWKSDRIWTRFGRRKPFTIVGWVGVAVFLTFIPGASSLSMLALVIIGYNLCMDLAGGSYQPLYMEVVPQPQRGRAQAMRQGMSLLAAIFLNAVLIGHYDSRVRFDAAGILGIHGFVLTGEQMAFWTIAAVIFFMAVLIGFGVKEIKPDGIPSSRERFSVSTFFGGVFLNKQQLKVYTLGFSLKAMSLGLGSLGVLMVTKQFHYSKEQWGQMNVWLKVVQFIALLPLAGFVADRFDRMKLYLVGITLSTLQPIAYWSFIHFVAENQVPSFAAIVCFHGFDMFVDFTVDIAMVPLLFDYIPRRKMGTVFAGMTICDQLARFLLMNAVGVFVKYYSKHFCAPGGLDYSSGLLVCFFVGVVGTACGFYFLRERKMGRVIPYGKLEHEMMKDGRETGVNNQASIAKR